jgi:hypothetical protein
MAGNVLATFTGQNLTLTEAPGEIGLANAVKFSNLPNAITHVEGLTQPDGTRTLINGAPSQDFMWVRDLSIRFGAGNDQVVVDPLHTPSYRNVQIDLAAPPLMFTTARGTPTALGSITFVGPPIFSVADDDVVDIGSLTTSGSLGITTGIGADRVSMTDFNIGGAIGNSPSAPRNLTINTGSGADSVSLGISPNFGYFTVLGNLDIQTYSSLSENDADSVSLSYSFLLGAATHVRLGGGNDTYNSFAADAVVDAGAGNDQATISWGTQQIDMGDGDDTLQINALTVGPNQQFRGGNGVDHISYQGILGNRSLIQFSQWEYINGRRLPLVFATANWSTRLTQ